MYKVIVDTREQKNRWIISWFDANNIEWESRKLDFGDYAFDGYEKVVAVERKANLTELSGNFCQGRKRFEDEFLRASNLGAKMFLLVENCSGSGDIMAHRYRTKFNPKSFYASLKSWESKGLYESVFNPNRDHSGEIIYNLLKSEIEKGIIKC